MVGFIASGIFAFTALRAFDRGGAWVALACLLTLIGVVLAVVACLLLFVTVRQAPNRGHS